MLSRLDVENFESHKKNSMLFSPGLNVIVGESGRGKSGFCRAIEWFVKNKPGGDWMRPLFWEGDTRITGLFTDPTDPNLTIQRVKSKKENTYILNDNDPVAAGTSVPPEIAIPLDMGDINIQTQTDRAFLMFENPPERGRILNKIAGLDKIDSTLTNAKSDCDRIEKHYKNNKALVVEYEEELLEYSELEEMEKRVLLLEKKEIRINNSKIRINNLKELKIDLKELQGRLRATEKFIECDPMLQALSSKLSEKQAVTARIEKLKQLKRVLLDIDIKLNKDSFDDIDERLEILKTNLQVRSLSSERIMELKQIKMNLNEVDVDIIETEKEIKELELLIPNNCPLCGEGKLK